jgi:hypothetical protein
MDYGFSLGRLGYGALRAFKPMVILNRLLSFVADGSQ